MIFSRQTIEAFSLVSILRSFSVSVQEIYRITVSRDGEGDYTLIQQVTYVSKDVLRFILSCSESQEFFGIIFPEGYI